MLANSSEFGRRYKVSEVCTPDDCNFAMSLEHEPFSNYSPARLRFDLIPSSHSLITAF